jgi:hypothetical protein
MRLPLSIIPDEIISKYNLQAISVAGWVYIKIIKGMYRLKQAGLLANQLLQQRLAPYTYHPARHTPGLWLHKTRPIAFTLVVDEFSVMWANKMHTICAMPYSTVMRAQQIGEEQFTQA